MAVTLSTGSAPNEILDLNSGEYRKSENDDPLLCSPKLALYVKDHFGLSDKVYHELGRICKQLPRLNQLKKLSNQLNSE